MKKEETMESISLKKMTLVVVLCAAGGFLVNANESPNQVDENKAKNDVVTKAEKQSTETLTKADKESPVFARLLKKSDKNKDGSLSKAELTEALDSQLIAVFDKIDTNKDLLITEQEFVSYSQSPKS